MLGHFPNSHFLQAGFCLPSAPEVTSIALSRKLTIFSQRSSGLAVCSLMRNSPSLLVGTQNGAATLEGSLVVILQN